MLSKFTKNSVALQYQKSSIFNNNINNLMTIITLTTDYGLKDHYVSSLKGAIFSENKNVTIVDISHQIDPFNIHQAAYIIKNAYQNFPEGTIHIIGVNAEVSIENEHLVILFNGQYFICANNGILSILTDTFLPEKIIEINAFQDIKDNFPTKSVFTKVACHIARGGNLDVIGKPFDKLKEIKNIAPVINANKTQIIGSIIYIDHYGNIITNISKTLIKNIGNERDFQIIARRAVFKKIHNSYNSIINFEIPEKDRVIKDGEKMALYNSNNLLEIALYKSDLSHEGGASSLLGLGYRDRIFIEFKN